MKLFDKFKKKEKSTEVNTEDNIKLDIRIAFENNLKYISNIDKNAEDINRQFQKTNTRFYLKIGSVNFPTGNVIVADPLAYLPSNKFCPILEKSIPIGEYPVEVSICRSNEIGIRMCTVRLKIKKQEQ